MWKKIKPYVISSVIALAVGGVSALLTRNGMDYYAEFVNKPSLSPPMWLFPVVWSILYVLMGISSAIIFVKREENPNEAAVSLKIYGLQLVVNFFWSIIFFNLRNYLCAFIWLLLLLFLIILMILQFRKISSVAAYLQIPYLLWVTFAGVLTWMVYMIN
jgi:tryptophan-rich sensory protein